METGHANHEKFIQIRGKDRQKLHAFQEGMPLVLGFFQDPLIELQSAELTIQEMVRLIKNLRWLSGGLARLCRMIDHGGSYRWPAPETDLSQFMVRVACATFSRRL